MIGTILDNRYEIIDIVGSGGMAVVYKAKCRLLNRYVAIKMLRDELKSDAEFVEKFRIEAQSAASLNHNNIVSVYYVGNSNGNDYFVMEFIDGITLKELINTRRLDWREACHYAQQICEAIDHAHHKNIVHRDIKPHNIMITHDNLVKVTDFGIARAVSSSTIVRSGNVIGSVHYFSPEQACGGAVDFKSDIYSIGIVLYEMVTGHVPFNAENPVAVAKMHVDNQPEEPIVSTPEIPRALNDIILKAITKKPQSRYQSASEFASDLRTVLISPELSLKKDDSATQFVPVVNPSSNDDKADSSSHSNTSKSDSTSEDSGNSSKPSAGVMIVWISASIIALFALVLGIFACNPALTNSITGRKTITIPNLVGSNYDEITKQYANAEFKINVIGTEASNEYDANIIVRQTPDEGLSTSNTVDVVLSSGRKSFYLDNYVGQDVEKVRAELDKKDIKNIIIEYESHEEFPENTVFKMSPGQGSSIRPGDKVTLFVSTGKNKSKIKVPAIEGLTKEKAIETLNAVGLKEGEISERHSSTVEKGKIISQVIAFGTEVDPETEISFVVSLGVDDSSPDTPSSDSTDNGDTSSSDSPSHGTQQPDNPVSNAPQIDD